MDHPTITLDDEVGEALRARAASNGRSMEEEARRALRSSLEPFERPHPLMEIEMEERVRRILALGRKPVEPFDQKAFSDGLNDFVP